MPPKWNACWKSSGITGRTARRPETWPPQTGNAAGIRVFSPPG
jgi:hypothetical protein